MVECVGEDWSHLPTVTSPASPAYTGIAASDIESDPARDLRESNDPGWLTARVVTGLTYRASSL